MTKRAHIPVRERRVITVGFGRSDDDTLRALATACPNCGRPPAHRITEITRKVFLALPGDLVAGTIQCQSDNCRTIYDLLAKAYQEAR